ncbi:MAG: lysyl oxidase family protein, partial [Candidatus Zixiibacteriota bacterium]
PGGGVGPILAEGPKTSFCVIDFIEYDLSLPNSPPDPVFFTCEPGIQGISVGWIDIYELALPGQEIDITDLPGDLYWLEGEFDPENKFLEANKVNNIARKAVTLCHQAFTVPADDSMWLSGGNALAGSQAIVTASVRNQRTLGGIVIPFSWVGPLGLLLDSVSTVGTRVAGLTTATLIAIDPFNSSAAYALSFPGGVVSGLSPGSGPVLKLYFTIPPGAPHLAANEILITEVGGQAAQMGVACGSFTPPTVVSGLVTNTCCSLAGDANSDGSFNIADITFGIARIFANGPAPQCQDGADANGDNAYNIADITFGIARIFAGGPAPICGLTGT